MTMIQTNLSIYVLKVDETKKLFFVLDQVKASRRIWQAAPTKNSVGSVFGECLTKIFLFKLS